DRQHVAGEYLPVGGHDQQLGPERLEPGDALGGVDALGLEDGDVVLQGDLLHADAGLARGAALLAGRAVRLGDQAGDGVRAGEQGLEGGLGEGAGAHHDDAHGVPYIRGACFASASASRSASILAMASLDGMSPRSWALRYSLSRARRWPRLD